MSRSMILFLLLCTFSVLLGCSSSEESASGVSRAQQDGPRPGDVSEGPSAPEGEVAPPALDEATLAALASADAMDGTADHVVSKCAGCKLMMDGKQDHSVAVGDYTLHLCSTTCRDHFVGDLSAGLAGLPAAATPAAEAPAAEAPAAEAPAASEKPAHGHDHGAH